jgi:hypothetical protein
MVMTIIMMLMIPVQAEAKDTNAKALKEYKSFLAKNVSKFSSEEGDFATQNSESYKKSSLFLLVDMNADGISELVTYHPDGWKSGFLYLYQYKNGKFTRIKTTKNKAAKISEVCTAQGWYDTYSCNKGHLHVRYEGGYVGYSETIYTLKNGKLNEYLYEEIDELYGTETYKKNGKKISQSKFKSLYSKCDKSGDYDMRLNTKTNRDAYLK